MSENLIAKLGMDFALRIVKLRKHLMEPKNEHILSKQVLRSGTSIGANIYESEMAQTKADFIAKLHISLKEANETKYWLELLYRAEYIDKSQYESMDNDVSKITGTLVNIIKKTKENLQQ